MAYRNLRSYPSDGSSARWPRDQANVLVDPPVDFLASLERFFHRQYIFSDMPQGYAVFNHTRNDQTTRAHDTHIYGHKEGHYLSAREFGPHVRWLVRGMTGICTCKKCRSGRHKAKAAAAAATRARDPRPLPPPPTLFWQLKFLHNEVYFTREMSTDMLHSK
ncbi:hypothetical protein E4T47_09354 [Aureobasidium subglaciale]|nr:hypothetical protein E4T47_09354 [Aureobasidium subglaciale]